MSAIRLLALVALVGLVAAAALSIRGPVTQAAVVEPTRTDHGNLGGQSSTSGDSQTTPGNSTGSSARVWRNNIAEHNLEIRGKQELAASLSLNQWRTNIAERIWARRDAETEASSSAVSGARVWRNNIVEHNLEVQGRQ